MEFDRRKREFLGNFLVLYFLSILKLPDTRQNNNYLKPRQHLLVHETFFNVPITWKKYKKISLLTDFPFTHSVARELDAIADPQPNVLNFASTIFPSSSTLIYSILTSSF